MAMLKQISDKGATIAWSPLRAYPSLLATGTKEGGGGGFDDYGGELSVHSLDMSSTSLDTTVISSIKTPQRFSSLAWGAMSNKPALRHGLIVGGMADGVVNVWDAASLMNGATDGAAIAMIERHSVAVRAVQFNPHPAAQHLIGAGSIDGDISIINLEAPAQPSVASPMSGGQKLESEVTSLSWNTSVTHILATATVSGVVVVWDLKENKPWCQLRDPHRASISDVAWAPNDGLYLVTACDDDSRPVLRLWDLRSSTTTPLCEFAGHTKGILSVDWCPHDPNLLVSCGKDAHTFVWDIQQGRAIAEVPAPGGGAGGGGAAGWGSSSSNTPRGGGGSGGPLGLGAPGGGYASAADTFGGPAGGGGGMMMHGGGDPANAVFGATLGGIGAGVGRRYAVRWSKHLPAVFAACSFDRRVTVHGVAAVGPALAARAAYPGAAGQAAAVETTLRKAPRWLRRPVSAVFGFGGKLVTFGTPLAAVKGDLRAGAVSYAKAVNLNSVCTDHEFVSRALAFEATLAAIESGAEDVRGFCARKAEEASRTQGATAAAATWSLMRLLFEPNTRAHILAHLGYEPARVVAEVEAYAGKANLVLQNSQAAAAAAAAGAGGAPAIDTTQAGGAPGSGGPAEGNGLASIGGGGGVPPSPGGGGPWASAEDVFSSGSAFSRSGGGGESAADVFGASGGGGMNGTGPASSAGGLLHARGLSTSSSPGGGGPPPPVSSSGAPPSALGPSSSVLGALGLGDEPGATYAKKRLPSEADNAMLKRAVLVGDFPAAVAACLKQDRLEDALLLSGLGSPELWAATQEEIFRRRASPLMSVMQAVIKGELAALVASSPLQEWRETLALLCTYAKPEAFSGLCEALGDRLAVEAGDATAAVLAYMCSGAVKKTINIWVQEAGGAGAQGGGAGGPPGGGGSGAALQACVEKILVFRRAVFVLSGGSPAPESAAASAAEAAAITEFAMMLANEGYLSTAATFAARVADSGAAVEVDGAGPPGAVLRDRLARAFSRADYSTPAAQAIVNAPFPLPLVNVGVAPLPAPAAAAPSVAPSAYGDQQQQQQQYDAYGNPVASAPAISGYDAYGTPVYGAAPAQQPQQQVVAGGYGQQAATQQQQQPGVGGYGQQQQQPGVGGGGYGVAAPAAPLTARGLASQAGFNQTSAPYGNAPAQQQQQYAAQARSGVPAQQVPQQPQGYAPQAQQQQQQPQGFAPQAQQQQPQGYAPQTQQQPQQQQGAPSYAAAGPYGGAQASQRTGAPMQPGSFPAPQQLPPQSQLPPQQPFQAQQAAPPASGRITTFTPQPQQAHMMHQQPPQAQLPPTAVPQQQHVFQQQQQAPQGYGQGAPSMQQQQPPQPVAAPPPQPVEYPISADTQAALGHLQGTIAALETSQLNTIETRQLQEAKATMEVLRQKLIAGAVSADAQSKLCLLASQCSTYDFGAAQKTMLELARIDWDKTKEWQKGVRNIVTLCLVKSGKSR